MRNAYTPDVPASAAPRRMSRDDRRASLLDAAVTVLRSDRDTALTFEAIAAAADVSPTLPYKYFDSVDELAVALYQRVVRDVDDETDRIIADPGRTIDDKLVDTFVLWRETLRREGMVLLRLTEDATASSGVSTMRAYY